MPEMKSWFPFDKKVTYGDDDSIELKCLNSGSPLDVSSYTGEYKAISRDGSISFTIDSTIVLYDSGSGTTDSFSIPLDTTDLDIQPGQYDHRFTWTDNSGQKRTIFKGTLFIDEKV